MGKFAFEIKWGVIFSVVGLLWMVFEKLMGWHGPNIEQHATMTNLFAIVAIAVMVIAIWKKHTLLGQSSSFGKLLISGLVIAVVVAVLSPLTQWITTSFLSPEYFPNAIEYAVKTGHATQEEAEGYFNQKSYIIMSTIGAIVMGAITSLLVAGGVTLISRKS